VFESINNNVVTVRMNISGWTCTDYVRMGPLVAPTNWERGALACFCRHWKRNTEGAVREVAA
jgi:hypothetical protein